MTEVEFKVGDRVRVSENPTRGNPSYPVSPGIAGKEVIYKGQSDWSTDAVVDFAGEHKGHYVSPNSLTLISSTTNPDHYQIAPGVEVIDLTEHLPFLEGNIVKYVVRHRNKNGLEDLEKARWYLDRLIANITPKEEEL